MIYVPFAGWRRYVTIAASLAFIGAGVLFLIASQKAIDTTTAIGIFCLLTGIAILRTAAVAPVLVATLTAFWSLWASTIVISLLIFQRPTESFADVFNAILLPALIAFAVWYWNATLPYHVE